MLPMRAVLCGDGLRAEWGGAALAVCGNRSCEGSRPSVLSDYGSVE
jgi:hypothetical protein